MAVLSLIPSGSAGRSSGFVRKSFSDTSVSGQLPANNGWVSGPSSSVWKTSIVSPVGVIATLWIGLTSARSWMAFEPTSHTPYVSVGVAVVNTMPCWPVGSNTSEPYWLGGRGTTSGAANGAEFTLAAARGRWLAEQQRFDEALQSFVAAGEQARSAGENELTLWAEVNAAGAMIDSGRPALARPHLEAANRLLPASWPMEALLKLHWAEVHDLEQRPVQALRAYESILKRQQDRRLSRIDNKKIAMFFRYGLLKEFRFNRNASTCQLGLDDGVRQLDQNVISNLGQLTFELEQRQVFQTNVQPKFDAHG